MPGCRRPKPAAARRSTRSATACRRPTSAMKAPRRSTRPCSARTSRPHEANRMSGLQEFVADLLEQHGAVVEALEPDIVEVLAPDHVRQTMGWPELARLGFGA